MSGEIELFELSNALVTNRSFYVRHRSFPLQSISDIEVIYHPRTWRPVIAPLFAAVSFAVPAVSMHKGSLYVGVVVFMLIAALAFWKGGLRYTIALETAAGYVRPMTSRDRFMVESLQQVLGDAVRRAHQQAAQALEEAPVFRIVPGKAQRTADAAKTAVAAGRPTLLAKKPPQPVHPSQTLPHVVGAKSLRNFAVAGSSR